MANKLNSEQIETIIDYYVNKEHTLASIQRELGFAPTTSRKYLVKNGIEIKSSAYQTNLIVKANRDKFRKYQVNKQYFDEWSNNMAYIVGFLITDGSVYKNRVKLTLQRRDRYMLEQISEEVGYTGVVLDYDAKIKSKVYPASELHISCYEWIGRLEELGVHNKNTFNTRFPDVPQEFLVDFLRGVFDGDGFTKQGKYLRSGFVGANYDFMHSIQEELGKMGLKNKNILKSRNLYDITYAEQESIKLYDILYSEGCMHLKRKKEVFEKYMQ